MPFTLGIGSSFALVRPKNAPNTLVFARHDLVDCYLSSDLNRPSNDEIIQVFIDDSRGYDCDIIASMVWYAKGRLHIKHLTLPMLSNVIINRAYPVEFEVNAPTDDEDCTWILQQFVSLDPKNHCSTIECSWMYENNCVIKKYTNCSEYSSCDNIFDGTISIEKAGNPQLVREDKVGGATCALLSEQVNEIYQLIANHCKIEGTTPELQLKCYFSYDKFGSLYFKWCHVDVFGALKSHVNSGDPSTLSPYKYSPSTNVLPKPKNNLFTKATFSVVALSMIELKDALQYLPGVKNIMIGTSNSKKLQKYIQVSYDNHVISYNELLQQVWTYIQRIHASVRADSGAVVAIHYHGEEQRQRAQQFYDEISGFLMQLPAIQVNIERLSVLVNFNNDDLLSEVSDVISYDQDVAVNINNDKLLSNIEGWQSAWLSSEAVHTTGSVNSDYNPKPPGALAASKGGRKVIRKQQTVSHYKQSLENPYGLKDDFYVLTDREKFLLHEGDMQESPQGGNRTKETTVVDLEKIGALSKPRVAPLTAFIDDRLSNYNVDSSSSRVNTAKSVKRPISSNSNRPSIPTHKRYYKKTMPGTTSTFKIHRSKPKTYIQLLFGGQIENVPKVKGKFKANKKTKPLLLPEWVAPELHPKGILSYDDDDDDDLSVGNISRKSTSRPSSSYSRGREVARPESALQPSRPTSSRSTNQSIISTSRAVKTHNDSEISDNLEDSANASRSKVTVVPRAKTPPVQQRKLRLGQAMARKLEVDHTQYHADVELHDRLITNTPKSIPYPNGLAGDIMVIINRMTASVTKVIMNSIKHARKIAVEHHNTLMTELSGNVGLTHERTLSAERMRNIIELVTSGYYYDKNIKFTNKKAQENYKKATNLYSEMSPSEHHLVQLLQLFSCIPNHRPVDNMITVVLWLLSTGGKAESEDIGELVVTSLDQPIEENYSKVLKNVSRFIRGCQSQIKVINAVENQRSVDRDKASIRQKDKCIEELKAWYSCKEVSKDYEHMVSQYNKLHQESVVMAGGTRVEQPFGMEQVSISASISSPAPRSHSSAHVNGIKLMRKNVTNATDESETSDDGSSSIGMIPSTATTTKAKDKLKAHLGMEAFIRSFNTLKQAVHVRKEKDLSSNLLPLTSKVKGNVYVMSLCELTSTSADHTELICKPCNASMPVTGTSDAIHDDDSLLGFNPLQEESLEINGEYVEEIDDDFPLEDLDEDETDLRLLENTLNNAVRGIDKEYKTMNNNIEDAKFELDNELLFHKLAPNISLAQRNMLLLSVVSDTNRTILLCISVLLKYLQAGKDITYDDMVNLLCTPVARAIGRKNLDDLLTWLRVNRKVGISFHPTASLSWTELAIQKITSIWPVLNVAVFEQENERDSDSQAAAAPASVCTVQLEWLEKQKIMKLFSAPNTFHPNLNNI